MDAGILLITAIQIIGLIGAVVVRVSENSQRHLPCLVLFFSCLMGVGLAAMLCLRLPSGVGILSGFTLGIMMIATTCDFRASEARPVDWSG